MVRPLSSGTGGAETTSSGGFERRPRLGDVSSTFVEGGAESLTPDGARRKIRLTDAELSSLMNAGTHAMSVHHGVRNPSRSAVIPSLLRWFLLHGEVDWIHR
jgi:hypothetical protein